MAITKLTPETYVSGSEYAYTSTDHMKVSPGGSMPMYVPKLMPNVSNGEPTYGTVLTRGELIFANDPACMPSVEGTVRTQNFISPSLENNNTFDNIVTEDDPIVKRGTRLKCTFINGNLQNIKFTTSQ